MLVYRICDDREITTIINERSFNNIGKKYISNNKLSTHKYDPNKKYIHFFKKYSDIFYLNTAEKTYICIYDIPDNILEQSKGIGFYIDRMMMRNLESVEEYAIDIDLLSFDYLIQADKIQGLLLYEEYLGNDYRDKIIKGYINSKTLKKN